MTNGILIINKPKDYTSRDIVNIVSKKFNTKKVGHAGTLDPLATGVLVVALGKSLKILELLTSKEKEYIAKVILGYETDMLDITGTETKRNIPNVTKEDIEVVLKKFTGKYMQEVPIYSAVKVNGRKLYEYARNNIPVKLPVKEVEVYSLKLLDNPVYINDTIEFTIKCKVSKGTYIRSLIRDIGYALNTYGTMKELVRTNQGIFDISNSYTLDDLKHDNYRLLSIKEVLPNIKNVVVDDKILFKIKNGQVIDKFFDEDMALILDKDGNEIAIYIDDDNGRIKPYKMIEV